MAFVLYMSLVVIILLNLLIAIMGHSYDEIREREIDEGRMEKARALVTIERTFRPWLKKYEEYYFPKHLHVLKPKIFEKQEHNILKAYHSFNASKSVQAGQSLEKGVNDDLNKKKKEICSIYSLSCVYI